MQSLHKEPIDEVKDERRTNFFIIDNEFIDTYAKKIGTISSMIYFVLCRHANKNGESFPSQKTIGEKLGVSPETIKKRIQILADLNLIKVEKTRDVSTGQLMHNTYTLLDRNLWLKPTGTYVPEVQGYVQTPGLASTPQVRTDPWPIYINKTHTLTIPIEKNELITQEIPNDLDAFKVPSKRKAGKKKERWGNKQNTEGSSYQKTQFKERRRGGVDYSGII